MIRKLTQYILTLLVIMAGACSPQEDFPTRKQTSFAIQVQPSATESSEAAPSPNELINTWWMAFADQEGVVRLIIERDPANTTPVEMESFTATLDLGTYTVYSFANIHPSDLGLDFQEGKNVPSGAAGEAGWAPSVSPHTWKEGTLVPMSGRQTVTVTGQVTQPFSIEVVRMVAKMEFLFSNASESDMYLHQLWMRPMGSGKVDMFPAYTLLGDKPTLRQDADTTTVCRGLFKDIPQGSQRSVSDCFYTLESRAEAASPKGHPTGHYVLLLDVTRHSGDPSLATRDTVSMLTQELTYINRNDWVRIPVRLGDYIVRTDVKFYPPIGGYPAVVIEEKGRDSYIRFGTQGKFVITPLMREGSAGSPWMQPSQLDIQVLAVTDPSRILAHSPAYDAKTGEITGELDSSKGTAVATLSVGVKGSPLSYLRDIYIIRE